MSKPCVEITYVVKFRYHGTDNLGDAISDSLLALNGVSNIASFTAVTANTSDAALVKNILER